MKTLQPSKLRAAALWAGIGIVVVMAPAANAFTFNDAGSDKRGDTSMFNDPVNRAAKSGLNADGSNAATDQRPKSGLYFGSGRSQSFDERNSGDRYFNPNTLMGR